MDDKIDLQNKEFNALAILSQKFHSLCLTPVVDDDYPEVRHRYERALKEFLIACKANGRTM